MEKQVRTITDHFDRLCEEAGMTESMRERLRRRAVLNPDVFARCEESNPSGW